MPLFSKLQKFYPSVLILAVIAVYANAVNTAFVLDDIGLVENNYSIKNLSDLPLVLSAPAGGTAGRPLANLSFAINYAISGNSPAGYKITNILVHVMTALLLYYFLLEFFKLKNIPENLRKNSPFISAATSLLWAVHPLNTQAVTYVSQRMESLMAFFFLAAMYFAVKGWNDLENKKTWHLLAVVCAVCSAGFKEVAVMILPVLLLIDLMFVKSKSDWKKNLKQVPVLYLGTAAVLLYLVYQAMFGSQAEMALEPSMSALPYLLNETKVIARYFVLSFFPYKQEFIYYWPGQPWQQLIPYIIAVTALFAFAVFLCVKRRVSGFAVMFFFLVLAPTSSLMPNYYPIFEYRMYLPLMAVIALAVGVLASLFGVDKKWTLRHPLIAITVVCALVLGGLTIRKNETYKTMKALWEDTLSSNPQNIAALFNLATSYQKAGDYENYQKYMEEFYSRELDLMNLTVLEAIEDSCEKIIENYLQGGNISEAQEFWSRWQEKFSPIPFYNYYQALICYEKGDMKKTEEICQTIIDTHAEHAKTYNLLGIIRNKQGHPAEALKFFEKAIDLDSRLDTAWLNAGNYYASQNDFEKALFYYDNAYKRACNEWEPAQNLGFALLQLGRTVEAENYLQQAVELRPEEFNSIFAYGVCLVYNRKAEKAIGFLQKACALSPQNAEAVYYLGMAFHALGRSEQASQMLLQARQLRPGFADY